MTLLLGVLAHRGRFSGSAFFERPASYTAGTAGNGFQENETHPVAHANHMMQ